MATRRQYQQAVSSASTNVRAKTQALNEANTSLTTAQATLDQLQGQLASSSPGATGYDKLLTSVANARQAVQRDQNRVAAAQTELNNAKVALTSAQLELNSPDTVFDPEPVAAAAQPGLTQAQRDRLDLINEERVEKDQSPLLPTDPAALAAIEASIAQENAAQNTTARDSASSNTAGDAVANATGTPSQPRNVPAATSGHAWTSEELDLLDTYNQSRANNGLEPLAQSDPAAYQHVLEINAASEQIVAASQSQNTGTDSSVANPDGGAAQPLTEEERSQAVSPDSPEELDEGEFQNLQNDTNQSEDETRSVVVPTTPTTRTDFSPRDSNERDSGYTADGRYRVGISGTNQDSGTNRAAAPVVAQSSASAPVAAKPSVNPLHAYASYTYNISLHVLTPEKYKQLINNPGSRFVPSSTLISSANRYGGTARSKPSGPRDPAFTDDFYFENLKIETVVGLQRGGSTTINFTIIEPYGLTLLNRLLDLSVRLKAPNYLDIPYLLEISFFGSDDNGIIAKLENQTKFIPIKMLTAKIKAGTKGSEYDIQAIAYNKLSNMQSIVSTKANFEITGRTVGSYFANKTAGSASLTTTISQTQQSVQQRSEENKKKAEYNKELERRKAAAEGPDGDGLGFPSQLAENQPQVLGSTTATVRAESLVEAYNTWLEQEVKLGLIKVADQVEFVIDSRIANSKIIEPTTAQPRTSANDPKAAEATDKANNSSSTAPKSIGGDFTKSFFNVNAGTSILKVLDNMIINSDYITSQIADKSAQKNPVRGAQDIARANNNKPVYWYKVSSKIEILGYDENRGYYAKKITFYVNPYVYHEASFPGVGKNKPSGVVKEYNYIYTGKNIDIIDFNLEFNSMFSTMAAAAGVKQNALSQNPDKNASPNNVGSGQGEPQGGYQITPSQVNYISSSHDSISGGSDESVAKQQAKMFAENIYSNADYEMLEVKLKIIGDPQFIKQDDVLFSPDKTPASSQYVGGIQQGSFTMDRGEIFAKLVFKTPVDIDENTGLVRKDSAWNDTYFSGLYKILTVTNEFSRGKFIQVLKMVRLRNQPGDQKAPVGGSVAVGGNTRAANSSLQRANPSAPTQRQGTTSTVPVLRGVSTEDSTATDFATQALDTAINNNPAGTTAADIEDQEVGAAMATRINNDTEYYPADAEDLALGQIISSGETLDINSGFNEDVTGEAYIGPTSSTTQAVLPPQPAAVVNSDVNDTPPVQSQPAPVPTPYAGRQTQAAETQIATLTAQGNALAQQYSTLYADFAPKQAQLRRYDQVINEIDVLLGQATVGSPEYARLVSSKEQALNDQRTLLASVQSSVKELEQLKAQVEDINSQIRTIKANSGTATMTDAELAEVNALADQSIARQNQTGTF
jgi:hypothetical protein